MRVKSGKIHRPNMRDSVHRQWLRELRIKKCLTMHELGVKVGRTEQYIGDIEHGRRNPSAALALQLSEILGFSVDRIIRDAIPAVQRGKQSGKAVSQHEKHGQTDVARLAE